MLSNRHTYLFCLYKDPDDPTKLRPIGIPSAIRRIITSHVASCGKSSYAIDLLPYNFAIGVDQGMDFIIKATQLGIERYIQKPQLRNDAPTRAAVYLDLKNMFNSVS